jgi:archaellum biogenesis ATPase FlaH
MSSGSKLDQHIETVAKALFGDDLNRHLSKPGKELRFGTHGSLSVDLQKGTFFDFEDGGPDAGGGVLDLLRKYRGMDTAAALKFMEGELGLDIKREGDDGESWKDRPREERAPRQSSPRQSKPREQANGVKFEKQKPRGKPVAFYDYQDFEGRLFLQVVRYEMPDGSKTFRQRTPKVREPRNDAPGDWNWTAEGVELLPYRLPELMEDLAQDRTVFLIEGEKAVDYLRAQGIPATCNPMGRGKINKLSPRFFELFKDGDVVVIGDNDPDGGGQQHATQMGERLEDHARRVRVIPACPGVKEKGGADDWLADGHFPDELYELATVHGVDVEELPPVSLLGAISPLEIMKNVRRVEWLADGIISTGSTCVIYGGSGSGKSLLVMDLAMAIARGTQFLDIDAKQAGVLYQAGESYANQRRRIVAYMTRHGIDKDFPFRLLERRVNLFTKPEDVDALIAEIRAQDEYFRRVFNGVGVGVVIIDTLAAATAGAVENASEDMTKITDIIERVQREAKVAVIVVHHTNAVGERERGHGALRGAVDFMVRVEHDKETNIRTLEVDKNKEGAIGLKRFFRAEGQEFQTPDGFTEAAGVIIQTDDYGERQRKEGRRLPDKVVLAKRILADTLADRGVTGKGGVPIGVNAVTWDVWRDVAFGKMAGLDDTIRADKDAYRKAQLSFTKELQDWTRTLMTRGEVGRSDDGKFVWLAR